MSNYSKVALSGARTAALLAAAALPFSTAAVNILFGTALLAWLASGKAIKHLRSYAQHPLVFGSAVAICVVVAATAWSSAPPLDRVKAVLDYRTLVLLVVLIPLFDTPQRRLSLLAAVFGGAIVALAFSLATYFGLGGLKVDPIQGAIVRRNHITHGFIMALLVYAAMVLAAFARSRPARYGAVAVGSIALVNMIVMTRGRTGWVVLFALIFMVAAWKARWKGAAVAIIGAMLLASIAYFSVGAVKERVDAAVADLNELERGNLHSSSGLRFLYLKRGLEIASEHPLFGAGTGSWKVEYDKRSAGESEVLRYVAGNSHNDYITTVVQFGGVGLALHLFALVFLFRAASRLSGAESWLARGLVVAYAAGSFFNSFLLDFTEGHVLVVLLAALYGGHWPGSCASRATATAESSTHARPPQ